MVKSCCIKNCKSEWSRDGDISFHSFPTDPEHLTAFVSAIPPNFVTKISKYSYICSRHFTVDSFQPMTTPTLMNRLKKTVVPTLFDSNFNCSVITTPNVVKPVTDVDDTDNQRVVESVQSTSIVNAALYQERALNNDLSHTKTLQSKPSGSQIRTQEIGVQTSEQYLPPPDEVLRLRKKVRVLQKRLQRRDTRLKTLNNLIQHFKDNGKCTD